MLVVWGAGCGGTSEPAPLERDRAESSPRPTVSPATQPTASPTPSTTTATPTSSLEQELYAATVNFYEAVTRAYEEMDPSLIEAVVLPNSGAGGGYIEEIRELKRKGHRLVPPPKFTVSEFAWLQDASNATEVVTFRLDAPAGKEVDREGRTVEEYPAGGAEGRITFVREGDRWLVASQRFGS